ncbi:C1 family peptidase [uncultured Winogradskyella sp.]|uniref:C1 family peptidase n=1 Tax=uncultured Winogradskyella sp. TaxID=395353 RepID=UPI002631C0B4|nr:C1 family peptidase [uncultured Winogradskyella sp.]
MLFVLVITTNSCSKDIDDNQRIDLNNQFREIIKDQYKASNGIIYYTGCNSCTSDGTYSFDSNNVLLDLEILDDLPEEHDLSNYLPPIGDQGRQGSCVSWASTYYLKSIQKRIEASPPYNLSTIMSPSYTYNQITEGICEGTPINSALEILKDKGTTPLQIFPYFDNTCSIQPTEEQDEMAIENKIDSYKYLCGENMILEMKTLIVEETPILISVFLTSEFAKTDVLGLTAYREHNIDFSIPGGCHAMLVVGYSEAYNAFKVVNSWGEDWGDNGFVWIDYAAFDNVLDEEANFKVISTALIANDL